MVKIKTKRLVLENLKIQDAYLLYSYRSLPSVEKYQSWKNYSYDQALSLIEQMKDRDFNGLPGVYQCGIYLNEVLIGDLYWELGEDHICWIGYTLDPHYEHQGYAYEAVFTLLEHLTHLFGIDLFMARILPANQPSIRLIQKLGFVQIYPEIYAKKV